MMSKRIVAFLIDALLCAFLLLVPKYGSYLLLIYFVLRDTKMFGFNSIGKRLCHIEVKETGVKDRMEMSSSKMMLRSVFLLVPILNIVDVIHLFRNGERLADKWMNTKVVQGK